jgi:hypothetical protein
MPDDRDDFERGYDAYMVASPFIEVASDEWKRGWREAQKEWAENEDQEF